MPDSIVSWTEFHRRPKILVVDDQLLNIRLLNEIFKSDCDVLMATDGRQAIETCTSQQPDLVLMDVMMPGMNGFDAVRQLKASTVTAHIPVIFLTGLRDEAEEEAGFLAGGVDFISKPIRPVIVRARVKTHLKLKLQGDLLRAMAMIDGLTGLANRRRFDDTLQTEWQRCARDKHPISLALIDIDFFKRYNDTYGHPAGDTCLREIARMLQRCLNRPSDLLARYGGEEFVCIMPDTNVDGAAHIAKRFVDGARLLNIDHIASDAAKTVTISVGFATTIPTLAVDCLSLISQADKALYSSKTAGRNRFVNFSDTQA